MTMITHKLTSQSHFRLSQKTSQRTPIFSGNTARNATGAPYNAGVGLASQKMPILSQRALSSADQSI